jgi:hypothetical protein
MSPLSRQFQSLGRNAHAHRVFIRPLRCQVITNGSINDRHLRREHRRQVYAACASWLRASRRNLRKLGSVQASKDGCAPRRGDRARQHRSGRCRGRRSRPSASCREFPSGRGSDKRTASTPTDACQRSRRVRRQAEADGFLVDEMSRVILNGYRCARSRCAECFGKQSTLGGVRRNRR